MKRILLLLTLVLSLLLPRSEGRAYGLYEYATLGNPAPELLDGEHLATALVFVLDFSGSQGNRFSLHTFFNVQNLGTASAMLDDACILEHLIGSPEGRVAISVVIFSARQEVLVRWTIPRGIEDVRTIASQIRNAQNYIEGDTGVGDALSFAAKQFDVEVIRDAPSRVADLSTNGKTNIGNMATMDGARALARSGIVLNAIIMPGNGPTESIEDPEPGVPGMRTYYDQATALTGGHVFAVPEEGDALDMYASTMRTKLCLEIAGGFRRLAAH